MTQTKKGSLTEAIVNTLIGLIITLLFAPLIYWAAGVEISLPKMGAATLMFTVLSVIRQYVIRRWFNNFKRKDFNAP